jgi:hypothetical protein
MNEDRIREIANLASTHAESTVDPFWDLEDGLDYPARRLKVRDLKFTELIIQECIKLGQTGYSNDSALTIKHYSNKIKDHFGVEE